MKRDFYYYEKRSPLKVIAVCFVVAAVIAGGYWYYVNYFRTADTIINQSRTPVTDEINSLRVVRAEGEVWSGEGADRRTLYINDRISRSGLIETDTVGRVTLAFPRENSEYINLDVSTQISIAETTDNREYIGLRQGRVMLTVSGDAYLTARMGGDDGFSHAEVRMYPGTYIIQYEATSRRGTVQVVEGIANVAVTQWPSLFEYHYATMISRGEQSTMLLAQATGRDSLTVSAVDPGKLAQDAFMQWTIRVATSEEVSQAPIAIVTIDPTLTFAASRRDGAVILNWNRYMQADFRSYQILRTTGTGTPVYGETTPIVDSSSAAISTYTDASVQPRNSYRYVLCIVKANGATCSSPSGVAAEPEQQTESSMPLAPTITSLVTDFGVSLSWMAPEEGVFSNLYIVRSTTNPQPQYPADGFIASFGTGITSYTDSQVTAHTAGTYYYRLCGTTRQNQSACSNVIPIRDGRAP